MLLHFAEMIYDGVLVWWLFFRDLLSLKPICNRSGCLCHPHVEPLFQVLSLWWRIDVRDFAPAGLFWILFRFFVSSTSSVRVDGLSFTGLCRSFVALVPRIASDVVDFLLCANFIRSWFALLWSDIVITWGKFLFVRFVSFWRVVGAMRLFFRLFWRAQIQCITKKHVVIYVDHVSSEFALRQSAERFWGLCFSRKTIAWTPSVKRFWGFFLLTEVWFGPETKNIVRLYNLDYIRILTLLVECVRLKKTFAGLRRILDAHDYLLRNHLGDFLCWGNSCNFFVSSSTYQCTIAHL